MSNCRIPLVSNIIPGLMSQEDKIKLDNWPNSPLEINNLSASNGEFHQLSASYFSMSSGSINDLVISRNLVIEGHSNITSTIPDPLSSSVQRSNQFSSSYFSMSSGSINDLLISRTLLVFGPTNITATAVVPDPLSSSVQRAHQLSASYFSMSSGSINDLLISRNLVIEGHSNITSTIPDPLSSSVQRAHQLSASYFSVSSGSINRLNINQLQLSGVANISPVSCKILFQNYSCTASTTEFIPLLSQSISPGESWNFYYILPCVLTGTGGIRFTVFSPTGSLIEGFVDGRTTVAASTARSRISSINTEVASTFNNATLIVMPHYIYFTIRNGNNSGNVTLGIRRITATDFCNVLSGSSMMATKIT